VAYADAVAELYQVPITKFVAERKRLADELKAGGDSAAAKQLLARHRPTASAWVVNQLYWHARAAFDEMMAAAERLREGDLSATPAHRDAIAKLRKRAATLLEDSGNSATEATLRRVTTTLSSLAATGGFDPDPPGALARDRDPPGFEAVGIIGEPVARAQPAAKAKHGGKQAVAAARVVQRDAEAVEQQRRREEMAEKKRAEDERKRRSGERHRLEAALRTARADVDSRERAIKSLEKQLEKSRADVDDAQAIVADLERRLAALD
jgi:hypothetical protein